MFIKDEYEPLHITGLDITRLLYTVDQACLSGRNPVRASVGPAGLWNPYPALCEARTDAT